MCLSIDVDPRVLGRTDASDENRTYGRRDQHIRDCLDLDLFRSRACPFRIARSGSQSFLVLHDSKFVLEQLKSRSTGYSVLGNI
jgi:hypothetical protein